MHRYQLTKQLGDGTFGSVLQAVDLHTGDIVAIKRMKAPAHTWAEVKQMREISALRKIRHPNVVTLYEVIREKMMLYFVFEHLDCNLYHLIKDRQKLLAEPIVRNYCFQILDGLAYMHENGYFHRDLKPENILVTGNVCKLADFGLAKEVDSKGAMTEYVSTRWYRAPEVLLRDPDYGPSVDIWAVGTIVVELMLLQPLFPGASEIDQLYKILSVLGTPTSTTWPKGVLLANKLNIQLPEFAPCSLDAIMSHCSHEAIELVSGCLMLDPRRRPSARRALAMLWFAVGADGTLTQQSQPSTYDYQHQGTNTTTAPDYHKECDDESLYYSDSENDTHNQMLKFEENLYRPGYQYQQLSKEEGCQEYNEYDQLLGHTIQQRQRNVSDRYDAFGRRKY